MSTPRKKLTTETEGCEQRSIAYDVPFEQPRVHVMEAYERSHAKYADLYRKLAQ
jgi:hypothetical protein